MSYSAVAALIAGYAALRGGLSRCPPRTRLARLGRHLGGLAYTSLLAGGASMPFAAYQFQQLQPYWIPANLLAVPLTAFWIMPWGLIALALMPLHLAPLALLPMGWGIAILIHLTALIATWPDALLLIKPMPGDAILLIAAGLAWLCIFCSRGRFAGLPAIALGLALAVAARPPDVLVSPDARLIALRDGSGILLIAQPKASRFTLEQWRNIWGGAPLIPARCPAISCPVGAIWYTTAPVCHPARLIVAPVEMPSCPEQTIDRFFSYRQGAIAAWITTHGVILRTDRQMQGVRPWVTPYPQL
jgi:competence protein ComEC